MGNRTSGRKEIFELLRSANHLQGYTDEYGNQTLLNPVKHFVYQKQYKNDMYNRELINIAQKYSEYMKRKAGKPVAETLPTSDPSIVAEVVE